MDHILRDIALASLGLFTLIIVYIWLAILIGFMDRGKK